MKRVLSFLLMIAFSNAQVFAISGGPNQVDSGKAVLGTYAGVMLPVLPVDGATTTNSSLTENSLGIFVISVPQAGVAAGSVAFFTAGEVFTGTLNGIADPDKGDVKCLFDAATTLRAGGATSTTTITGQALGKLEAKAKSPKGPLGVQRIEGTAHADLYLGNFEADGSVEIGESFDFIVDGYQQSPQATGAPSFVFTTSIGT